MPGAHSTSSLRSQTLKWMWLAVGTPAYLAMPILLFWCALFASDPMQSFPGTQSPLYEIPSVTVTSTWLLRKHIPEAFPQGDCNMHTQSNPGLVSTQGNLKFKQPHISILFFKLQGPHIPRGHKHVQSPRVRIQDTQHTQPCTTCQVCVCSQRSDTTRASKARTDVHAWARTCPVLSGPRADQE